jgi:hypothetical protein
MPTADCIDRWHRLSHALRYRAETSGLLRFAGFPPARIQAPGTRRSFVPLV